MSDSIVVQATELSQLAKRINEEHAKCERALKDGLQYAVEAGKLLIEAKSQHEHGGWLKWLKANFAATPRTAQSYMWLSTRMLDEANAKRISLLGYSSAVARLQAEEKRARRASYPKISPSGLMPKPETTRAVQLFRNEEDGLWSIEIGPNEAYPNCPNGSRPRSNPNCAGRSRQRSTRRNNKPPTCGTRPSDWFAKPTRLRPRREGLKEKWRLRLGPD